MKRLIIGVTRTVLPIASLVVVAACGSYDTPATTPSPTMPGAEGSTIAITSSGLMPPSVMISSGQSVTFVNNDTQAHQVTSGPVPSYDACPAINNVGRLEPGQSLQTGALSS